MDPEGKASAKLMAIRIAIERERKNPTVYKRGSPEDNTIVFHRMVHEPRSESHEAGGMVMTWTGLAATEVEPGSTHESRFEIEGDPAATHVHRQRHFPEAEVLAAIESAGLKSLGVWGDYEGAQDQPLEEERHQKAIYVAGGE